MDITTENLNALYNQLFGTDAPQSWVDQTMAVYGANPNATLEDVQRDTSKVAASNATPFSNVAGDQGSFTSGADYFQKQGLTPGKDLLEGIPTQYFDKDGNLVASYGSVTPDQGGSPLSRASGDWTWNMASSTPKGETTALAVPQRDYNTGWLDALKGVGMVAGGLGGAAGLDALLGGAVSPVAQAFPVDMPGLIQGTPLAAPAGELAAYTTGIGSLTEGLTPEAIAAQEAALPGAGQGADALVNGVIPASSALPLSTLAQLGLKGAGALASLLNGSGSGSGSGSNLVPSGGTSGSALPGNLQATALQAGNVSNIDPFANLDKYRQIEEPMHAATGGNVSELAQLQNVHPKLFQMLAGVPKSSFFTYGADAGGLPTQFMGGQMGKPSPGMPVSGQQPTMPANASETQQALSMINGAPLSAYAQGGDVHVPEFITGATGHYVKGRGDGQSDDIPAMLADGEYVFDADTVAQLGNGSSDAGAKVLDKMREALRAHKRSANVDEIPPKSKSPLEYIREGMKRK